MKKKIIVTGGLGFIGSNLIELLIDKGFFVLNIDKVSYASNFYNTHKYKNNKNYKFLKLNINNKKKLLKVFKKYKPHGIFNLAAETHVDRSIDSPEEFIKSNILGTYNLLEAFKKYSKKNKNSRLVHISTDEVYGDIIKGRTKENHAYRPTSPYAASKASSDHIVFSYFKTFGIKVIITKCSNNYGPRQHPEKLIPKMIYNIINNKPLKVYGDGKNSREWIYVKDHCEALIKIFKSGKIGETYNIGSNKNLNNIEICKYLINFAKKNMIIGRKVKINFIKDRPGHDKRYALNSSKLIKKLKWKATTNFSDGIKKTFMWYLNNKKYYKALNLKDIIKRLGIIK